MKIFNVLIVMLFLSLPTVCLSQLYCGSLNEARYNGIDVIELDAHYPSGFWRDTSGQDGWVVLFGDKVDYLDNCEAMYNKLSGFLFHSGWRWEDTVKYFSKVYFSNTGEIDYYFYNIINCKLDSLSMHRFDSLVCQEYIRNYRFGIIPDTIFKQCGSIILQDKPPE